jgi:hypothetical protein
MQLCTRITGCVSIARTKLVVTGPGMSYPGDVTDEQWELTPRIFNASCEPSDQSRSRPDHQGDARNAAEESVARLGALGPQHA